MDKMRKIFSKQSDSIKKKESGRKQGSRNTTQRSSHKSNSSKNNLGLYVNLARKRQIKKDAAARARAEYLASLPKNPVKRFFYHFHPKRIFKYWFSKKGGIMLLKIAGVGGFKIL